MADLLNANLSSDEEDDDYRPDLDTTAEAEDRKEFKEGDVRVKAKRPRPKRGGGAEGGDEEEEEDDHHENPLEADNDADPRVRAKKAKIDQLWSLLNGKGQEEKEKPAVPTSKPAVGPSSNVSLAALCKTVDAKERKKANTDLLWMKQLGILPKGASASTAPKSAVPAAPASSGNAAATTSHDNGKAAATEGAEASASKSAVSEAARAAAAAAMQAAKEGASLGVAKSYGKVTVTETRRFAGKDIQVQVQVDKNSKEAKEAQERATKPPPSSGLDAFLQAVEQKKKVTVFDKTKADWSALKAKDATLEEELEAHKRSGGQYLEKVDFLKRAELREYEQERDKRLASDVRTRGRL